MPVNSVERISACRLALTDAAWPFATRNAGPIDAHWQRRSAENPSMFNGIIHLLVSETLDADFLAARFLRTDFKSYLYWRETGFPEAGVRDGFGSALIRSAEGHVVLGRQRAGNINAGLAYLPGGFIDQRDVSAGGTIDIDGSILRELAEETGLTASDVRVAPGYILTRCGALVSVARELLSPLTSAALRKRILQHIAADPQSELIDAVVIRSRAEIHGTGMHAYARQLLEWLLPAD